MDLTKVNSEKKVKILCIALQFWKQHFSHTSSVPYLDDDGHTSECIVSSTMSFMDFNSLVSFAARHSMSCICLCENEMALCE